MSRSNWDTQELIDAASRHEALPSRQRMVGVREAVLRRALIGGAVTVAGSTTFLAKAAALGATTVANVAMFAAMGAVAGGVVVGVTASRAHPTANEPGHVVRLPAIAKTASAVEAPLTEPPRALAPVESTPETPSPSPAMRAPVAPAAQLAPTDAPPSLEVPPRNLPRPADILPQQLDVLRRMRSDLSERRAAHALSLFRENEILFRGAPLEPEARGAYIAALCQLGRDQEAKGEAARLLAAFPASHLAQRLAAGCASASNP